MVSVRRGDAQKDDGEIYISTFTREPAYTSNVHGKNVDQKLYINFPFGFATIESFVVLFVGLLCALGFGCSLRVHIIIIKQKRARA